MRARWLMLALALTVCACADDGGTVTAPTPAPVPTARANLLPNGLFRWTDCFALPTPVCTFTATLRNAGAGCANRVEGSVRFFNSLGLQVGGTYRFVLPAQQLVMPGETIPFFVPSVPSFVAQGTIEYTVTPVWVDTPCF